ncbi:uncharacterized protein N7487_006055 [Penicillium crustosum]|uniref:uncharacterized protein n=1 Tax=Penicillium crustosum TaxID=36656 RepID=UPI002389C0C9|nr:uncharacterized protein N7487_006055 [Penicillium crustosum]KAJ5411696.1 hypothetical protein N7487_006055 [Penicillium crustosum]
MAVVSEVAILEIESRLHRDMGLWLDIPKGNAQMAITVKASRMRSTITVGKWEWNTPNVSLSPTRVCSGVWVQLHMFLSLKEKPTHPTPEVAAS